MEKIDKKYIEPIFEEHNKLMSQYESSLSESVKKINKAIDSSIKNIASSLGNKEETKMKFKHSVELEQLYEEFKQEISNYDELTTVLKESSEKLQEKLHISKDDLEQANELINQRKKIEEEIVKLNEEISKTSGEEADNLGLIVLQKEEELEKITEIANKNASVHSAYDSYFKNDEIKNSLDEINETYSKIENTQQNINKLEEKFGDELTKTNSKIETKEKRLTAVLAVMKSTFDMAKKIAKKWAEVDEVVTKYGRTVGQSSEQTKAYRKNVLDNFGQMAGRLGMTVQEIMKFQEQYTKNTGRAIMLTNQQVESLAGLSKITSDIATETMVSNMDNFGASVDTASGYLAQAYARASQVGLNAAKTSETFANNIKMASKYSFREGINGISKMTMLSQRLKFNIESMSSALDKFSTIEGAISTSANIQLLGGSYAAQFSNPMQAMGEALLDAEGFTKRIIDTFSSFAYFDKEKGMADMNPFEKQRMKLAAQELGINYDEAWNIATQSAKAKAVEKEFGAHASNLDEGNKEYLKNLAQYDTDKKAFYVTYYENGQEQRKDIREITSNEQVEAIRRTDNKEAILQDDVHQIKGLLHEYVKKRVGETKTVQEIDKGIMERAQLGAANAMDPALSSAKDAANWFSESGTGTFGVGAGAVTIGKLITNALITGGILNSKKIFTKILGNGKSHSGGNNIPSSGTKPSSTSFSQKRSLINKYGSASKARSATKFSNLSKVGGKALKFGGKTLKFGGAALGAVTAAAEIGTSIYGAVKANKNYKENIKKIDSDRSLSSEEKAKAKYDAKKTKNKATGKAIGSTAGAIIGGAIGLIGGPAGVAIGAGIGASIGKWIGGKTGSAVTKKPKGSGGTYNESDGYVADDTNKTYSEGQTTAKSTIESDVHNIYELLLSGKLDRKVICMSNSTNNSNSSYDYGISSTKISTEPMVISKPTVCTKTYIKEEKSSNVNNLSTGNINIEPINLSVNGSIKLVGDKNVQTSIDVNKLFDNNEFNSKLVGIIAECLRTNTLKGRMVSSNNTSLT